MTTEECNLREALAEGWTALALRLVRAGDWSRAALCAQIAELLSEAAEARAQEEAHPARTEADPEDLARLAAAPPGSPMVRTARGGLRPRTARRLG
ncbi:MAG: hypothetical protein QN193_01775 [Armatimonadota bacterium]|nr:hypothetical protein [Armatimonadota bacterium]MDR7443478.1 hypothetical protein [Armatimonadota bacterium]MDR7569317.1 hypothetical protein [Armatimonadota bacterium]MDR7614977.1 hypothetical protein [Armatimonadota bacterium]